MDNQPQQPQTPVEGTSSEPLSRREARHQRMQERREARGGAGAWIGGLLLIALGVIFLLQNQGITILNNLQNWWALFILIPAVGAFANAWRAFNQAGGRLNAAARGSLIGGLILTMVAAIFLFNLDWGLLGPVLIILVGAGVLLNTTLPG